MLLALVPAQRFVFCGPDSPVCTDDPMAAVFDFVLEFVRDRGGRIA